MDTIIVFTVFALLYASGDSYLYLIPVILSTAIWAGLGFGGLINESLVYFKGFKLIVPVLFGVYLVLVTLDRWPRVDASQDDRAEQLGAQVMASAPQNAIVFAEDDQSIFGLGKFRSFHPHR